MAHSVESKIEKLSSQRLNKTNGQTRTGHMIAHFAEPRVLVRALHHSLPLSIDRRGRRRDSDQRKLLLLRTSLDLIGLTSAPIRETQNVRNVSAVYDTSEGAKRVIVTLLPANRMARLAGQADDDDVSPLGHD